MPVWVRKKSNNSTAENIGRKTGMKNEIAEVQDGFRAVVKEAVEETALRELETIRTEKLVARGLVDEANAVGRARLALGRIYWPNTDSTTEKS
jgi:hypothetical protein